MHRLTDVRAPIQVNLVECTPAGEKVIARLEGIWLGPRSDDGALLVIEAAGRRHRFPELPPKRFARRGRPEDWRASFEVPAWLEPYLSGHAELLLGNVTVRLPDTRSADMDADGIQAPDNGADEGQSMSEASDGLDGDAEDHQGDRSGQPVEETLAALHAELQERAGAEAQLHGMLARIQAELEARIANATKLEHAQTELRSEFEQLQALIEHEQSTRGELESRAMVLAGQSDELREQLHELTSSRDQLASDRDRMTEETARLRTELAASHASRDAAAREAEGLRAELERLSGDLASAREQNGSRESAIGEAEALLAEARALRERMSSQSSPTAVE
jgi:hypothetical protein